MDFSKPELTATAIIQISNKIIFDSTEQNKVSNLINKCQHYSSFNKCNYYLCSFLWFCSSVSVNSFFFYISADPFLSDKVHPQTQQPGDYYPINCRHISCKVKRSHLHIAKGIAEHHCCISPLTSRLPWGLKLGTFTRKETLLQASQFD